MQVCSFKRNVPIGTVEKLNFDTAVLTGTRLAPFASRVFQRFVSQFCRIDLNTRYTMDWSIVLYFLIAVATGVVVDRIWPTPEQWSSRRKRAARGKDRIKDDEHRRS